MSESVEQSPIIEAEVAKRADEGESARTERSRAPRATGGVYRRRFAVVYVLLALVTGLGIGALVVLLARPDAGPDPVWSAWEPTGSETARVRQIADHVAKSYRTPSGDQLVVALGGPPTVTAGGAESATNPIPIRAIAVRPDTSRGQAEEDDIQIHDASTSMQFVLCGLGDQCSIDQGEASQARHSLLRREALELALYTFKYVDGIDSVTVFLPPPPGGETPATAVFLRRGDVKQELSKPLRRTIAPGAPPLGQIPAAELQTLNRITLPRLYNFEYTQAQDLSAVLVLDPMAL
ncbi:MAG TPA: hypothetical protein VFN99_01465 [Gaiella sp.]|nr:hypothetical protein [Gaiella sp.]